MRTFFKKYARYILLFFFTLLTAFLSYSKVLDIFELQTYDRRCQFRGDRPISKDIVFIDIWDDTLEALGAWPFDRGYHADLIKVLNASGAKVIAFDVLFVEPREGDDAVAQAAKEAGNVYFVEAFHEPKKVNGEFVSDKKLASLIELYQNVAKGAGHVNAKADPDGKRRRTYPYIIHNNQKHYTLGLKIAMDVLSIKDGKKLKIPLDQEGFFLVNFARKWGERDYMHYSYFDVLTSYVQQSEGQKPRIDLNQLKGKICFVGLTSLGSHDTSAVPRQSVYPMVGMHANLLNSILTHDFIRRADRFFNLIILFIVGFWTGLISFKFKPFRAFLMILATILVFTAIVLSVFNQWGLWLDLFYPVFLILVIYTVANLTRAIYEIKKRELIENELKIASQIQKSFLPESAPELKGLSIAVYMKPAKAVGGDLYAFLPLSDDKVGVMVGDVSGKGTPAALFMAKVVSEFKFSAREKSDPAEVLFNLNDLISSDSTGGLFVTLTYAVFDVKHKQFISSNGGHLPVVVAHPGGESELVTADEGMPIGVMPGIAFANLKQSIQTGDCFAFYSDGVSEARNKKADEYGIETLQRVILKNRDLSAQGILDKAIHELNEFMGKAEQHDDITLIIVKVEPQKT